MRAVLVTPLSGSLRRFGREGAEALRLWAEGFGPGGAVDLVVHDAHPDTRDAMGRAVADRPDIVFGPYGTGPLRAAARATERLVWNHGGASPGDWSILPNVLNVLAPADTYLEGAIEAVHQADPDVSTIALVHVDTGFGRTVADGAEARATDLGFTVARVGFPRGDAHAAVDIGDADVVCVAAGFADEVALARDLLGRRYRAAIFVGAGEEGVLAALGSRREGLLGPSQWLAPSAPDPAIGPSAETFVAAFRDRTGTEPSYPAAQAFAAGLLAGHAVRTAGSTDDEILRETATDLDSTTLFGRFRLDPVSGRQVGHRVLTVQWQDGRRRVVWPPEHAETELRLHDA